MTATTVFGVLAGAAAAGGAVMIVLALTGMLAEPPARPTSRLAQLLSGSPELPERERRLRRLRYAAAPIAGAVVWLVSGWPVAGAIVASAIIAVPALFGTAAIAQRSIGRLEALEGWTRRLADLRAAGSGLEQSLTASLRTCPQPIAGEVAALVARLQAGWRIEAALHAFADDLNHPAADLVVAVLVLEAERRGGGVSRVLTDLADKVAEEVAMRRQVEADRAKPRTTARWITAIALATVAAGAFNQTYIRPYGTPAGQLVLAALAIAFAGCLWWMRTLALGRPEPRILTKSGGFTKSEGSAGGNPRVVAPGG